MPDPKAFGRRALVPPAQEAAALALSPEAEAFRARLAAEGRPTSAFAEWRRSARGQQLLIWALTLAPMAAGLFCFAFDAPLPVSVGLEISGVFANGWLRRARHKRLRDIVAWEEGEDDGDVQPNRSPR